MALPWNSSSVMNESRCKQVKSASVLRFEKFATGFFTITVENVLLHKSHRFSTDDCLKPMHFRF